MYPYLARFGLGDQAWLDPAIAGAIFLVSLISALIFYKLVFRLVLHLRTPTDLAARMMHATQWPVTLGILVLGGYLALTIALELTPEQQDTADKVFGLLGIALGIVGVTGVISRGIDWYLETLTTGSRHVIEPRLVPLLRRIAVILIYGVGGLLILDLLEINISPLIAGLGLGGLAVALAIQPTLANLFAGTYVMTEGVVSPGDYIELEGSVAGYVVDVGWRSTRIRTWKNNLVVVPNAKFAETIITNYQRPAPAVNVWLNCGVSYDSDLYQVEKVCHEVMAEVLEADPNAIKEYGGWFGFDSFDDSNVKFWLFVQAKDRWGSFVLQTALMQRLHQRLKQESIAINYPMRTLQFPKEWTPENGMGLAGSSAARRSDGRYHRRRGRRRRLPRGVLLRHDDAAEGTQGEEPSFGA